LRSKYDLCPQELRPEKKPGLALLKRNKF